ncbi:GntR family transcriptional regulator [Lachnospiraceae bacterium 42-17]|jgi:DNA-binding GntR family transcriptional regulator|nr:GntR family transcriptional regulator [Dorea sp.]
MAEKTASLAGQAYERIRQNILNLTYPPGMPLTEAMLTKELNMSRSPVRSAIQKLEAEGLIVSDYHKSMTVKDLTDKDIREMYQFRELMESAAFQLIFSSGRYNEYSYRLEEKVVRMCALENNLYEWQRMDNAMHMEIISIFENSRINKIYENNLSELLRIGQYSVKNGMNIPKTNENLRKMVRHMRDGSFDKSYAILRDDHLITGKDSALKRRR